jgi:hypothetical protein
MLKGSCLCGGVQYEYDGTLGPIVMCHCSQCRRAQGSAHATNSPVEAAHFRFVAGRALVRSLNRNRESSGPSAASAAVPCIVGWTRSRSCCVCASAP